MAVFTAYLFALVFGNFVSALHLDTRHLVHSTSVIKAIV